MKYNWSIQMAPPKTYALLYKNDTVMAKLVATVNCPATNFLGTSCRMHCVIVWSSMEVKSSLFSCTHAHSLEVHSKLRILGVHETRHVQTSCIPPMLEVCLILSMCRPGMYPLHLMHVCTCSNGLDESLRI